MARTLGEKAVDVAVEIRRELVGVVEQAVESAALAGLAMRELRQIVELNTGDLREAVADDVLAPWP